MVISLIILCITSFLSVLTGYMYEVWKRRSVLIFCMICLAIGMILPKLFDKDDKSAASDHHVDYYSLTRMAAAAVADIIMENPLLNDYVKKRSQGWAHGF